MSAHLQKELESLKRMILGLCALVEESVKEAVKAVEEKDATLVERVVKRDSEIDDIEIRLEEECLKILALHQPVAVDLRFIIAALKINNDLERIGDLAVNIVERAEFLANQKVSKTPFRFHAMLEKTIHMLKKSLDALVNLSSELAFEVCKADDEIDELNREMFDIVKQEVRQNAESIDIMLHFLSISRHIERIADHATNIAEDVIYMVDGKIIRHKKEEFRT